jgi:hypothetical protein
MVKTLRCSLDYEEVFTLMQELKSDIEVLGYFMLLIFLPVFQTHIIPGKHFIPIRSFLRLIASINYRSIFIGHLSYARNQAL